MLKFISRHIERLPEPFQTVIWLALLPVAIAMFLIVLFGMPILGLLIGHVGAASGASTHKRRTGTRTVYVPYYTGR